MGLQKDLRMSGNDFSWLATGFFIAYAVAEIPHGIFLPILPSPFQAKQLQEFSSIAFPSPKFSG